MKSQYSTLAILLIIFILVASCSNIDSVLDSPADAENASSATIHTPTPFPIEAYDAVERNLLTFEDLMNGFDFSSPVNEAALTIPEVAAPSAYVFRGRLELKGEATQGDIQVLRGELEDEWRYIPEFDFAFVQSDSYLIPVQRASIITDHPNWNYILEPGRVWQENGDHGYSRASFPFALVVKGGNATFNGTMTFLFNEKSVSKVWFQITQETTSFTRANFWGLLEAEYHPEGIADAELIKSDFELELKARFPTKPIEALAEDYPGVDISAFGQGVTPEHLTWFGFVINGVNYVGGCQTRFGVYPYCESMRATSYSTAKSAFASVALMRLAQKYGPEIANLLIKDYVTEAADSSGDWERVTFDHTIDMSTGNFVSPDFMVDDEGSKMDEFFSAQPYAKRIALAFDWPNATKPGQQWVYHTNDTFILTRALHNYLQIQEGSGADIFDFVVQEVYRPLGLGPGAFSTMRTADNNWNGQAEGGYGLWWIPDDIAKIATLLNNDGGQIAGKQLLHPDMLAASMQRDPDDRGVRIGQRFMYNNAFWANKYTQVEGFDCEFWVPQMQGVSGNVVALMPNGTAYYYFSDNREFTWDAAVRESNKLIPMCGGSVLVPPTESPPQTAETLAVSLPPGQPPIIDGTLSPGEWENATIENFADGSELYLMQHGDNLYLAIRANTTDMIVGNIFINQDNEIAILHTSAALGTAIYQQEGDIWQQTQGFNWCCRETSGSASAQEEREDFLQQQGWVSINSRVGTPNELEYQIDVGSDPLRLAVNYIKASDTNQKIPWPTNLKDDCIKPTPGGLPLELFFSPDTWAKLDFSTP